jgi:hypothetical protein
MRSTYKMLIGKPEEKRLLVKHRCAWEDKNVLRNRMRV